MTHEDKIDYMRIATGVIGYGFDNKSLDLLVSVYELVLEKQGKSDLSDVVKIESEVKKRADKKHESDLLDKFSDKVGQMSNGYLLQMPTNVEALAKKPKTNINYEN